MLKVTMKTFNNAVEEQGVDPQTGFAPTFGILGKLTELVEILLRLLGTRTANVPGGESPRCSLGWKRQSSVRLEKPPHSYC